MNAFSHLRFGSVNRKRCAVLAGIAFLVIGVFGCICLRVLIFSDGKVNRASDGNRCDVPSYRANSRQWPANQPGIQNLAGYSINGCKDWTSERFDEVVTILFAGEGTGNEARRPNRSVFEYLALRRPDLFIGATQEQLLKLSYCPGVFEGLLAAFPSLEIKAGGIENLKRRNLTLCRMILSSASSADDFDLDHFNSLAELTSVMTGDKLRLETLSQYLDSFNRASSEKSAKERLVEISKITNQQGRDVAEAKLLELDPLGSKMLLKKACSREEEVKKLFLNSFVTGALKENPREGMVIASKIGGRDRMPLMQRILRSWLDVDPMAASQAALEIYKEDEYSEMATLIVEYLEAKGDVANAQQWRVLVKSNTRMSSKKRASAKSMDSRQGTF